MKFVGDTDLVIDNIEFGDRIARQLIRSDNITISGVFKTAYPEGYGKSKTISIECRITQCRNPDVNIAKWFEDNIGKMITFDDWRGDSVTGYIVSTDPNLVETRDGEYGINIEFLVEES